MLKIEIENDKIKHLELEGNPIEILAELGMTIVTVKDVIVKRTSFSDKKIKSLIIGMIKDCM